jgi:WD40 repeat protein
MRRSICLVATVGCAAVLSPAAGQEKPNKPEQFTQSVERPNRTWDYDGKRILGHVGEKILLWDATTGKLLHKLRGHKERIFAVRFSPDGRHALSSSWMGPGPMVEYKSKDTRTILWDLETGSNKSTFPDQVAGEFSPDGKRIVTFSARPGDLVSFDAVVWDAFQGRALAKVELAQYSGPRWDTLHFSPDGRRFAHVGNGAFLLYNSGKAVLFDAGDGRSIGKGAAPGGDGHRYTSTGALASFGKDKATLTDIESGRVVQSVPHDLGQAQYSIWTHDGSKVASLHGGKDIKICDIGSGKIVTGAKCGPYPLRAAIVSPDNRRLAVEWGGANRVEPGLGIYDMGTGQAIARINLAEWGHVVGFSPDGKTLLVGGSEFVIYDSENGNKVRALKLLDDVSFEHDWNQ